MIRGFVQNYGRAAVVYRPTDFYSVCKAHSDPTLFRNLRTLYILDPYPQALSNFRPDFFAKLPEAIVLLGPDILMSDLKRVVTESKNNAISRARRQDKPHNLNPSSASSLSSLPFILVDPQIVQTTFVSYFDYPLEFPRTYAKWNSGDPNLVVMEPGKVARTRKYLEQVLSLPSPNRRRTTFYDY